VTAKTPKRKRRTPDAWVNNITLQVRALTGYMDGRGVRPQHGPIGVTDADLEARTERWGFSLALPVAFSHRQTIGFSLSETRARGTVEAGWRQGPSLRIGAHGGVGVVNRPDWPDLYQPLPDGAYIPTDRYSHFVRNTGVQIAGIPVRHHHARLEYAFAQADHSIDPAFDPIGRPNHLTPSNNQRHTLEGSWRYLAKGWKAGLGVDAFARHSAYRFSRDAGTGSTHVSTGGLPPNPLQYWRGIEPSVSAEVSFWEERLELKCQTGVQIVDDVFAGYYSYHGLHPGVRLTYADPNGVELRLRVEATLRRYGVDSYAESARHPPLAWGNRRADYRGIATASISIPIAENWAAIAETTVTLRRTNFPAYQPGIFPSTALYDFDWNYNNFFGLVGVEYRLPKT